jgi:DNA-directed RNA polymerase subunit omega
MDNKPRGNAMHSIPDDVDASTYRFIIVSAKRARQLQNGQRSLLPATNKKPTTLAMEEVRRGLVPYSDVTQEEALAKQEAALLAAE